MKRISIATLSGSDLLSHRHKASTGLVKLILKNGSKTEKTIALAAPGQNQLTQLCKLVNEGEEDEATRFLVTSCFLPTWSMPHYPPTKSDIERVVSSNACAVYLDAVVQMLQSEEDFPVLLEIGT